MAGEWRSAAEWAALNLPEVPGTKQGFNDKAKEGNWQPTRPRQGRGGGLEYHVTALPEAARIELARRELAAAPPPVPAAPPAPKADLQATTALTTRGRERLDAKLAIVRAFDAFAGQAGGQNLVKLRHKFAGFYNAGEIAVEPYVRQERPTISVSSLERWSKAAKSGAAAALAGRYGNRKGTGVFDRAAEDVKGWLVAAMVEKPYISAEILRRMAVQRFGEYVELFDGTSAPMPTERHIQRILADWQKLNRQLHLALTNPDAWKNRHRVAFGSASEGIERPNQLWEIDASPADVLLTDGRHSIYVVVDVFTRRIMILVTKVPKSAAVLLLIRRAVLAWGMPEAIKTDNGSDFVSRQSERAYALLGCAHPTCTPYSPEQKPHVERAIGTVQHSLMPMLDGYTGHDVATRQAIRSKETFAKRLGESDADAFRVALTRDGLQAVADAWVEQIYHQSPHAGLGDRTPAEVIEAHAGTIACVADERQLDILLMPLPDGEGTRTVGKKGIRVENADFQAVELIPFINTGERFEVRLDPEDMGRVYVYRPDPFEFVCIAQNPERTGLDRRQLAAEAKALQDRLIADGKAQIRAAKRRFKPHELADTLMSGALPAPAPAATITALPRAALPAPATVTAAGSAGLSAAARAIEATKPATASPRTSEDNARQADIARRIAAPPTAPEKPEERWWRRAQAIEARVAAGEPVSEDDLDWLASNRTSAWYEARKRDQDRRAGFARVVE